MIIQCSHCGTSTSLSYSASHVMRLTRAGWNSYGAALYCPKCSATWNERNKGRLMAGPENTIKLIDNIHASQFGRGNDREDELAYLLRFANKSFSGTELFRNQLRSLWTAYCFHHELEVDTFEYDKNLALLWDIIPDDKSEIDKWASYEKFGNFMCQYLV